MAYRWKVFTVVSVGVFVTSLDLFIVNIALPGLRSDFSGSSLAGLSWVLSAYAIVFAALLVPAGRIADRVGRRRAFIGGLAAFTVASALCAAAPSVLALVAARVLQAAGGAFLIPTSLGLLLPEFPRSAAPPPSASGGPWAEWPRRSDRPSAGLLVEASWRWVFLVNLPVGIGAVWAATRILHEVREPADTPRPDLVGSTALAAGIGALTLGIVKGQDWGWGSALVTATFAAAALFVGFFAWRSSHHPAPVVEPEILRVRSFAVANLANLLFFAAFGAMLLTSVTFMTSVWGYSTLTAGLALAPGPLMAAVFSVSAGRLSDRFGQRAVAIPGALLCAAGFAWTIWQVGTTPAYVSEFLPGWLIGSAGVGLSISTLASAAAASLPPERFATGTGGGRHVAPDRHRPGDRDLGGPPVRRQPGRPPGRLRLGLDLHARHGARRRRHGVGPGPCPRRRAGARGRPDRGGGRMSPHALARRAREMDGLEFVGALLEGELPAPPIAELLGFSIVEAGPGRAVFGLHPGERHYNPIGTVHGGVAATLLDSAMGCAVQTTLPAGTGYTTLELKVNFVRAVTADTGLVRCEGEVVHRGGTVTTAEGRMWEESGGRLLAHATCTCLLLDPRG